jgi:hypothetical protein
MKDFNVKFEGDTDTITILEGKALEQQPPIKINLSGDIKTVSNFLKVRKGNGAKLQVIDTATAIILVDKNARTIELLLDPENHYGAIVKGSLQLSDELKQFGINTTTKFSRHDLVKLIKMNRLFFESKEKHAELLTAFQKLESHVNYSSKDQSDDRGNKERSFIKNVETSAPMNFTLDVPIFKGFAPRHLSVEICLDIEEGVAKFWLESVQLNEALQSEIDEIFKQELEITEGFVIINK